MAKTNKKLYDNGLLRTQTKHILMNQYYELLLSSFEFEGLEHYESDYILRKLWTTGTLAATNAKDLGTVFMPYSINSYGLYDQPASLTFINERNIPGLPSFGTNQVDSVVGYINKSHKGIKEIVDYYTNKMVDILMSIYINTQTSKVPFIISGLNGNTDFAIEFIKSIYNDQLAIFVNNDTLNSISVNKTGDYIIDKLWAQYLNYKGELLTYFGIDNNPLSLNRLTADQTNSNNEIINLYKDNFVEELNYWFKDCNKILGTHYSVKSKTYVTESVHESDKNEAKLSYIEGEEND